MGRRGFAERRTIRKDNQVDVYFIVTECKILVFYIMLRLKIIEFSWQAVYRVLREPWLQVPLKYFLCRGFCSLPSKFNLIFLPVLQFFWKGVWLWRYINILSVYQKHIMFVDIVLQNFFTLFQFCHFLSRFLYLAKSVSFKS